MTPSVKSSGSNIVLAAAALLAAGLLYYAETAAFAWDEGFHLLAAQLIARGQRPYLDFFFPQTPLNAYWNALWFTVFGSVQGDSWRTAHAAAALCTATAALLLAQYVHKRSGTPAALATLAAFGLNELVFQYGGIAQAYGFCLLMLVLAFRCAIAKRPALTALFASSAAAASLLTLPALPIFFLWFAVYTPKQLPKFVLAATLPTLPILYFALQAPHEVLFQVFQYNLHYRASNWQGTAAVTNNFQVYAAFFHSPQAIALVILALLALRRTPETWLCAALTLSLTLYIATPIPTFSRYFVLLLPFLTILAINAIPPRYTPVFALLTALALARVLYQERDSYNWTQIDLIAQKVNEVTAAGAPLLADEHVYFTAHRLPPSGMEHQNSHKPLPLSPALLAALHILPQPALDALTRSGHFATVETCDDDETVSALGLPTLYRHSADVGECTVYWDPLPK